MRNEHFSPFKKNKQKPFECWSLNFDFALPRLSVFVLVSAERLCCRSDNWVLPLCERRHSKPLLVHPFFGVRELFLEHSESYGQAAKQNSWFIDCSFLEVTCNCGCPRGVHVRERMSVAVCERFLLLFSYHLIIFETGHFFQVQTFDLRSSLFLVGSVAMFSLSSCPFKKNCNISLHSVWLEMLKRYAVHCSCPSLSAWQSSHRTDFIHYYLNVW